MESIEAIQGYLGITDTINLVNQSSVMIFLIQHRIIHALAILIAAVIVAIIIKWLANIIVKYFAGKTKTQIDDLIIQRTHRCVSLIVMLIGTYLALMPLDIPPSVNAVLNSLIASLSVVVSGVIIARVVDTFIDVWGLEWAHKTRSTIDDALLPLFHKTTKVIVFLVCVAAMLKVWKFNISGLLAGVGIAGMILGLALKDSLANIFGGISIVMDKSVKVGDKIKLGSGETGVVKDIGLRSTKILTYDNEIVTVPNGNMANSAIVNYTLPNEKHRAIVKFSVEYGSDIEKVKKVVLSSLQGVKDAIYEPEPLVNFDEMADSGLVFSVYIWAYSWQKTGDVKQEATKRIYEALNKARIGIPFPTRTVYMQKAKRGK